MDIMLYYEAMTTKQMVEEKRPSQLYILIAYFRQHLQKN